MKINNNCFRYDYSPNPFTSIREIINHIESSLYNNAIIVLEVFADPAKWKTRYEWRSFISSPQQLKPYRDDGAETMCMEASTHCSENSIFMC